MNILILSNGAPGYHNFFNTLAVKFSEDGFNIHFAVDCETSKEENQLEGLGFEIHEFSSYFSNHSVDRKILDRYSTFNLNSALLSDYERAEVYNLWSERKPDFYEKLKSSLLSFFEEIIIKNKINVILYENVSNAFAHFAWFTCQRNNITYCGISSSRLPGRFMITDDPLGDHIKIQESFKMILSGESKVPDSVIEWCREYIKNIESIVPDYMKFNNLENTSITKKYIKREKIGKLITCLKHFKDDHYHSFQRGNPINRSWQMFRRSFSRKLRINKISKYYSAPNKDENFILYPLHYHPESSTSILAGTYLNELEVVRNISFNLPQGIMLYVKDHISAFGYPTTKFYKTLSTLPNVRLLSPNAPTKELIKSSKAVITLTSTVGYEALLLNKKVLLLGSVFYQWHKSVTTIKDPRDIFSTINTVLQEPEEDSKAYNENFIAAYHANTIDGMLNIMLDKENAKKLVDQIYRSIKTHLLSKIKINPTRTSENQKNTQQYQTP